jgi:hypothetical protein
MKLNVGWCLERAELDYRVSSFAQWGPVPYDLQRRVSNFARQRVAEGGPLLVEE